MGYRCVYDGNRLGIRSPLTLEEYLALPHLVTPTQTDFRGAVDDELVAHSKRRTVIYTTSRFAALPLISDAQPSSQPYPSSRHSIGPKCSA